MAFHQDVILSVNKPVQQGSNLLLAWTAMPLGGWGEAGWGEGLWGEGGAVFFQVYSGQQLQWHGDATHTTIPAPHETTRLDIGTVGRGEELLSFASSLPGGAPAKRRVELEWLGGTFEGADIAGFHVYGEPSAGAGVDYTHVLATITAYPSGKIVDGWGLGGWGLGGWGAAAGSYSWISGILTSGDWTFGVKPFDIPGNEGSALEATETILVPPNEPAPFADRTRLHYTLIAGPRAVLTWNASPN